VTSPRFANIEHLLAYLFEALMGGPDHTGSETPADLNDRLPFARFMRVDGGRDQLYDNPTVEVSVYALTEAEGLALADSICDQLLRRPAPHPAIDFVYCEPAPREVPHGDGTVRRFDATYSLELRRTRLLQ
jgi:hypothetical protein